MRAKFTALCTLLLIAIFVAVPGMAHFEGSFQTGQAPKKAWNANAQHSALEAEMAALKAQLVEIMQTASPASARLADIEQVQARLTRMQQQYVELGGQAGPRSSPLSVPPLNDLCAMATMVTDADCPFTDVQDTTMATNEVGEPETTCGSTATPTQSNSVWYGFMNTTLNPLVVAISTAGSTYDTVVQVYTGGCGAFDPCVCDDDSGPGVTSQLNFVAEPGILYLIKVADFDTPNGGNLNFSLNCGPITVANDRCEDATVVNSLTVHSNSFIECVDTAGATPECGEAEVSCASSVGADIWYKVTAPANGFLHLGTFGSVPNGRKTTNYDTVVTVYNTTNCPPSEADEIACNDDFQGDYRSHVKVPVTAGQVVLVRISGVGGATGTACVRFYYTPS